MPSECVLSARVSTCRIFWATAVIFLLQVLFVSGAADVGDTTLNSAKPEDNNLQFEDELSKRDWNRNLKMWGKRGWSSLRGGWAIKRDVPTWEEEISYPPIAEKRAWKSLQGGWGKRFAPSNEEVSLDQLATLLDQSKDPQNNYEYGTGEDYENEQYLQKRNWNKFNEGWGKRGDKWEKFRGSWGKREPAWSNLKGIWGKRSVAE